MTCACIGGTGVICACGSGKNALWNGLETGRSRFALPAGRVNSTLADKYPVFLISEDNLPPGPGSLSLRYFLTAAREAFRQAGVQPSQLAALRTGVCVGTSVDASFHCFDSYARYTRQALQEQDVNILQTYFSSSTALAAARTFGFTGPVQTVVTACASGTDSVGLAAAWIQQGLCDAVLCGGTDEINLIPYDGFIRLLIASKDKCKPFSKNRSGINIGEGAAALLLLSPSAAKSLGVTPAGFVLGYGNACDGYHPTAPDPQGRGLNKAISFALKQAGLQGADMAFVNAHATASQANDAAEALVFNQLLPGVPVCATKGLTGHTLGAAGALEAVITLMCLNRGLVTPAWGFEEEDPALHLTPVTTTRAVHGQAAVSCSLAFGGCNAALVLGGRQYGA